MQPAHIPKLKAPQIVIDAVPLTREAFAPFGDVVENPQPDVHPSSAADKSSPSPSLPFNAVTANQGSAIKYQHVSLQINLYDQAPSGRPGSAVMSMFVCAARACIPVSAPAPAPTLPRDPSPDTPSTFPVTILERHPYTTQTFIPLTSSNPTITTTQRHYLVIVAPTLPSTPSDAHNLPVPSNLPPSATTYPRPLPGGGMPDLRRLRAFVATAAQAVTYGAGTWHAPMVALGERGTAMDFVVVQFANGVGVEDCQEVFLGSGTGTGTGTGSGWSGAGAEAGAEGGVLVRLRPVGERRAAKL